jgi:predicted transcriptional regulator
MDIHITQPDIEAKLTQSAAQRGRHPDEFVQDVLAQYFDEEARFVAAVKRGDASLRRGEYLTHAEVGERAAACRDGASRIPSPPYIAVYLVTEEAVEITRIFHGAQDWP